MNLLFVDQYSSLGGAQQCLVDSLIGVLDHGWQASAALPGDGPLIGRVRSMGVDVIGIRSGPYAAGSKSVVDLGRYVFDTASQKRVLSHLLNERPFDLIYANGPRILRACVQAASGAVPVLFHAHNYLAQGYAAGIAGRSIRQGEVTVAACCQFVARPLASYVTAGNLHIVANGVSEVPYRRHDVHLGRRIGLIGRIAPEKGHLLFTEAARLVAKEMPETVFVVCGSAEPAQTAYFSQVRRSATGLPFEFIPWQERIDAVLSSLDLLVVPSSQEGAPRVILEAFSAGVPVLAAAVGGIPEMVEEGKTGFLCRSGPASDLATRITSLLADPNRLRAVTANARCAWEQFYNVALYRRRITELIESVVRARAPGSGTEPRQ